MQLQWERKQIPAMGLALREVQNQEQTLEVRLGEDMPDIGHIICGWGQPLLRGKDWHGDGIAVSGGIMAWILYSPEDGSQPRCVEGWLPFQLKWSMPPTERDGTIRCDIRLRGVDARVLSARKMMLRTQISALAEALEPCQVQCSNCGEVPQHIQLDQKNFPIVLTSEAGEVMIPVDEDVSISGVKPIRMISCTLQSKLAEQKVVGSRAIFRGDCNLRLTYFGEDEAIHSRDVSVPFAQYAQLDRDYDKQANAESVIAVSALEPELTEEGLRLKCTLVCQYTILDQHVIQVAQDAYSTEYEIEPTMLESNFPAVLDQRTQHRSIQQNGPGEGGQIVDACLFLEQPVARRNGGNVDIQLPGMVQVLSRDDKGIYHGSSVRFADQWSVPTQDNTALHMVTSYADRPRAIFGADGMEIQCDVDVRLCATAQQTLQQICEIDIGNQLPKQPDRPSLILRRAGDATLWELAKQYGSSVEQIRQSNGIEDTQQTDRMLLIPVN